MAKKAKRKASAPPMGYNARKKMNKHRPLTQKEKRLILIGIGVLVLAAILFAIFYDDGSLPMRGEDVVTEGAQQMLSYAVDSETGERAAEPPGGAGHCGRGLLLDGRMRKAAGRGAVP